MTHGTISSNSQSIGADASHLLSGGTASDAIVATTQALSLCAGGVIAAVAYSDETTGEASGRLMRLDAHGVPSHEIMSVRGAAPADGGHTPPVFSNLPDRDGTVLAVNAAGGGAIRTLDESLAGVADAITGLSSGYLTDLAFGQGILVALKHTQDGSDAPVQELIRVVLGDGNSDGVRLDTVPLGLSQRRRVTSLAAFSGALYVAVADALAGCEIYRGKLNDVDPAWERVLSQGGWRYSLNAAVSAMQVSPHGLLVGTAALAAAALQIGNWGPELLLFFPDGSWDLVIGQPRFTPEGMRLPASALMPGIDSPANAAVKAIAGGHVGGDWMSAVALQEFSGATVDCRSSVRPDLSQYRGSARIFRSRDLVDWDEVAGDLPTDMGAVTSLCVTEHGLLVGHQASGANRPPVTMLRH